MGDYSTKLNIYEWDHFVKEVKKYLIDHDMSPVDLAVVTGYSSKTIQNALNYYDRCSRFLVVMITEYMENHDEKK